VVGGKVDRALDTHAEGREFAPEKVLDKRFLKLKLRSEKLSDKWET
jgi:hypothetical protein